MGKLKGKRRLHAKAAKVAAQSKKDEAEKNDVVMETVLPTKAASVVGGGIFSNLNIDMSAIQSKLPDDFDTRSVITSKSFKGANMSKKDKMKMKKEYWVQKMDAIQTTRKEEKEKKKRQKTAIVGDMRPLEETLPTLELLLKESAPRTKSPEKSKNKEKPKAIKKKKTRQREMLSDISLFRQVVQHPAYKASPRDTIMQHLQNKQEQEDMDS